MGAYGIFFEIKAECFFWNLIRMSSILAIMVNAIINQKQKQDNFEEEIPEIE